MLYKIKVKSYLYLQKYFTQLRRTISMLCTFNVNRTCAHAKTTLFSDTPNNILLSGVSVSENTEHTIYIIISSSIPINTLVL